MTTILHKNANKLKKASASLPHQRFRKVSTDPAERFSLMKQTLLLKLTERSKDKDRFVVELYCASLVHSGTELNNLQL